MEVFNVAHTLYVVEGRGTQIATGPVPAVLGHARGSSAESKEAS